MRLSLFPRGSDEILLRVRCHGRGRKSSAGTTEFCTRIRSKINGRAGEGGGSSTSHATLTVSFQRLFPTGVNISITFSSTPTVTKRGIDVFPAKPA